jgi:hypothetical protein
MMAHEGTKVGLNFCFSSVAQRRHYRYYRIKHDPAVALRYTAGYASSRR